MTGCHSNFDVCTERRLVCKQLLICDFFLISPGVGNVFSNCQLGDDVFVFNLFSGVFKKAVTGRVVVFGRFMLTKETYQHVENFSCSLPRNLRPPEVRVRVISGHKGK